MKKKLKLVLEYKWYDMIDSDEKHEEYRKIKEHYISLLFDWRKSGLSRKEFTEKLIWEGNLSSLWTYLKDFEQIEFYAGYSKKRRKMTHVIDEIIIGTANPKWSDDWEGNVFVIKLL